MVPGIDPKVDYIFKMVFGSEANVPVLLHMLDAVLCPPPDRQIVALDLRNHLLELPKFKKKADELADPLDVWCYFLVHGAELDTDNLPPALRIPAVQQAMEVLRMVTQSEVERDRYEARLKAQRDWTSFLAEAREEGRAEAREEGRAEGRAEGQAEGMVAVIHAFQRLLKQPQTQAEELVALPLEELKARAKELEELLDPRGH